MSYHDLYDRERKEIINASLLALIDTGCTLDELIARSHRGPFVVRRYVADLLAEGLITESEKGVLHTKLNSKDGFK
jgi:hypothetical protein